MSAIISDGKKLAESVKAGLARQVEETMKETGARIRIVNILIGNDHSAVFYARSQQRTAEELGIDYELLEMPETVAEMEVMSRIFDINSDENIHGVLIHKPLPDHIDGQIVSNCVALEKDIEGMNSANIGNVLLGQSRVIPCTAAAVMEHLKSAGVELRGKEVVVIGASAIVGKPLALLLLQEYATVTVCHIATAEVGMLESHVKRADVVVVAVGKPGLIKGDMIKQGAVVIDVGINRVDGKLIGDVDFESVFPKASMLTPVPGGVGPMTVVMLMRNALEAYKAQKGLV